MFDKTLRHLIFGACFLASAPAFAQIDLQVGGTPAGLADLINGNGVQILNPSITCADSAYGTFNISGIPNFPNSTGLILSTGNVLDAPGPNLSQTTTTEWGTPGDPQVTIIAGATSFDACAFEFDIVPVGDTLRFNFTFASEEYQEYVGTPFNDVFAFLISGPGIVGTPGLSGFENIALVPGTSTPVGINTVNNGNPDIGFAAVNPSFFVPNPIGFNTQIEYDGWTTGLFAERILTACDTFRLKLVIADVGDRKWDSSVFIESIESNSISLTAETEGGIETMIEGCNDGTVIFTRNPVSNSPLEVTYFIGGTAINGVDYPLIGDDPDPLVPKTITIPANEAQAFINISPFDDGESEGLETIIFYIGNPLCPGTVQDSLVFGIIDELLVQIVPPLAFICPGDSYNITVNEGGVDFSWNPQTFLDDPTIKEPTATPPSDITYTLTTTVSECVASSTIEIRVSNLELNIDVTPVECGGNNDGALNLNVSGGEAPYDYEWTGPDGFTATSQNINNLEPGDYSVLVTDREGCTETASATVVQNPNIEITLTSPEFTGGNNVSCNNAENGQATAVVSGGVPGYTYQWNDAAAQTTQTAINLSAGTYAVTVTDNLGCEATAEITLTQPEPITGVLLDRDDVLCFGNNTGTITIGANGGTAPYTFLWNTMPPQNGPSAVGLTAGIYSVTITDVNGCIGFSEAQIQQPSSPLSGNVTVTPPSCNSLADGSAVATIQGGTPPYTYQWSTAPGNNTNTLNNLADGAYNLTITDVNGCVLSLPFNINEPESINISILNLNNVDCFGAETGGVTVNATGGTGTLAYIWNTTPETQGTSLQSVGAGTYTVTVTDENACTATLDVTIDEPSEILDINIVQNESPACDGLTNGNITVEANGGTVPYTYTWNTVPATVGNQLLNVGEGSYTVTAVDANGCTTSETITLTAPEPLLISIDALTNVLCSGAETGAATVQTSGGTAPYTYLWSDPLAQTEPTATGLGAGTYSVVVEDDNGCTATTQITITQPEFPLGAVVVQVVDVLCFGETNGLAEVAGTGGSGSYSYSWNDPASQQTFVASGLAPGSYSVTVTDNNGCDVPVILDIEIDGPEEALEISLTPSLFTGGFNVACADDSTATINLNITGGTAPYEVLWNLPGLDESTDLNLIDLAPGFYSVLVTDANGCTVEDNVTLTAPQPIEITFETTPSLCFGAPQGSITIDILGGVPDYTASWTGPGGFVGSGLSLTALEGGIYLLTVIDANGCEYLDAVTVIQPEDLTITVEDVSDINGFNTSCWNSQDGFIEVSGDGGVSPYIFTWNRPGNPGFSNQTTVSNLGPGTYEVVLIDQNGCVQNEFIELIGPEPITVDFTVSTFDNGFNISCNGEADGSISAAASGGTPNYNYIWIGNAGFGPVFGNPIENLVAGEYSVLVQDANFCSFASSVVINQPPAFGITLLTSTVNGSNVSCEGASDGVINLLISGNTGPHTILWSGPNGFESTSQNLNNLEAGTYCVDVTDANDCIQSACITLLAPEALMLALNPFEFPNGGNLTCGGSNDGSIGSALTGGTAPFNYSWSGPGNFTSNQANISGLQEGNYCLTVIDANGCEASACVELIAAPSIEIVLTQTASILCTGDGSAALTAVVQGGQEPYDFSWTGPNGFTADTQNISDLEVGEYCLTVTDDDACSEIACITVSAPSPLDLSLNTSSFSGFGVSCNGSANGFIISNVNGGMAPYTFAWSGPDDFTSSTANINNLSVGSYCLEVTDANGCTELLCADITEPDPILVDVDIVLPNCNDGSPAEVSLTVSGGEAPYTFNWSSGDNTASVLLMQGNYTVIVADVNDCEVEIPVVVTMPPALIVSLQSPLLGGGFNIACNGTPSGIINTTVSGGVGNISYEWSGTDSFFSDEMSLIGMPAGDYCVEATDELGCTGSACISITEPEPLVVSLSGNEALCNGSATGSITANVTGGVPIFDITWTGPEGFTSQGSTISQLAIGEYCANVSDLNGCTTNACLELMQPEALSITLFSPEVDGVNISCFGDNSGSIDALVTGGTAPYSFSWTGPSGSFPGSQNIQSLFAGEYCLTIVDANNCSAEACITLTEAESINVDLTVFTFPNGFGTSCHGECDASLNASITGGDEPYEISWIGPNGFTSDQLALTNLCPGLYILDIRDASDCELSTEITIEQPEEIEVSLDIPLFGGGTAISCFGDENGVINTSVAGGIAEYTFEWTGSNDFSSTNGSLTNLAPGDYELTVTDASGCTATASATLTQPALALAGSVTGSQFPSGDNISCFGLADGFIDAVANGGIEPYEFNWLGPDDFSAETASISELAPGVYTLVIEDANSCVFTINVTMTEPETELTASVLSTEDVLCHNTPAGAIEVGAEGGFGPYEVEWTGPAGFTADNFSIDDLLPGTYTYTVSDANGCEASDSVTLANPLEIVISGEAVSTLCESQSGIINVSIAGGNPDYIINWSNGATTQNLIDVDAGDYTIFVVDANGCESEATFTVTTTNNLAFTSAITTPSCFGRSNGQLTLTLSSGAEPITYAWEGPNGFTSSSSSLTNISAGTYTLTAIDANGCIIDLTIPVNEPDALEIENLVSPLYNNGFNLTAFESNDGVINAPTVSGGTPPYGFNWTGSNGFSSQITGELGGLAAGTYFLIVTDVRNCTDTASITLTQPIPLELPNGISPNGDGFNDGLLVRGLEDFPNNKVLIFNRWGNLLFEENNYSNATPWMGTNNSGEQLPEGTYFVIVELQGREGLKGYLELRR